MHDSMAFDPIASVHCMQQYMVEHNATRKCEESNMRETTKIFLIEEKARGDRDIAAAIMLAVVSDRS